MTLLRRPLRGGRWLGLAGFLGAAVLLVACGDDDGTPQTDAAVDAMVVEDAAVDATTDASVPAGRQFPAGFLFGTATAGFQVDPGCPTVAAGECTDANNDWYVYVTDGSMLAEANTFLSGQDPAEVGPGHYELYETDFDLATQDLHNNAFRMGVEWSRIFPTSTEGVTGHAGDGGVGVKAFMRRLVTRVSDKVPAFRGELCATVVLTGRSSWLLDGPRYF